MKTSITALVCLVAFTTDAFTPHRLSRVVSPTTTRLYTDTKQEEATEAPSKPQVKELGLLTFDLDDTLFPIGPIVDDANG